MIITGMALSKSFSEQERRALEADL